MEFDVLIVGGGIAGLSAAYHLSQLLSQKGLSAEIAVLEKGMEIGSHSLSGAVLNPIALKEMIPDFETLEGCPLETPVKQDGLYFLTSTRSFSSPWIPPTFHNKGNYIVSVSKLNRWLAMLCEAKGINIFPCFSAVETLYENDRVVGVRTGDKGRDKNGNPKSNFEEGLVLNAKIVIYAEGTRGSLFKQHAQKLNLYKGQNPDVFEEGVKEIFQLPQGQVPPGIVIHTMGFPLQKGVGGSFIYSLPGDQLILGLVASLDTRDPLLDPHRDLQRLKTHPFIQKFIKGGEVISYGGKTLPAGGWYSMPSALAGDGWMVCGDSAGMINSKKLKGLHLAMKSGMLAAETAFESLSLNDYSSKILNEYQNRVHNSYIKSELYEVRNFHQALSMGFPWAFPLIALQEWTRGKGIQGEKMVSHPDSKTTRPVSEVWGLSLFSKTLPPELVSPKPDGKMYFDKLSSVYLTGTLHDEDSPNHLQLLNPDVCSKKCEPKYKAPCTHFCPAQVYEIEIVDKVSSLKINYTNCIHCKTCDIKCPFENIIWTPPEGGGGPRYTNC